MEFARSCGGRGEVVKWAKELKRVVGLSARVVGRVWAENKLEVESGRRHVEGQGLIGSKGGVGSDGIGGLWDQRGRDEDGAEARRRQAVRADRALQLNVDSATNDC